MIKAREGFGALVDGLKKEKIIKSTLELVLYTESAVALGMESVDVEDWFVVSGVFENQAEIESLGTFTVGSDVFTVAKAQEHKCPRCWKYQAHSEDTTCKRCEDVLASSDGKALA